jgi:ubiquinone/menaquinone biosynthesis C-methylase UbiE
MSVNLNKVPASQLAIELLKRIPHRFLSFFHRREESARDSSEVLQGADDFDRTILAQWQRPNEEPIALWEGYRNYIKERWRNYYWPVRVLLELDRRVSLSAPQRELVEKLSVCRTLPISLEEILQEAKSVAQKYPQHIMHSDKPARILSGETVFAVVPEESEIQRLYGEYCGRAQKLADTLQPHLPDSGRYKTLEIGCGLGYLLYSFAGLNDGEVIGIDIDFPVYPMIAEQPMVHDLFLKENPDIRKRSRIAKGDTQKPEFEDNSFNCIYSEFVLEHIHDLGEAFREMYRMLKPGGIAYHLYDSWFGPKGGHSLCTLDFPWGHVVLSPQEFDQYIAQHRPHEHKQTLDLYHTGFQSPRLPIKSVEKIILETGFEILEWKESLSRFKNHFAFLSNRLLEECEDHFTHISVRDLLTTYYTMVLRKR